MKSIFSKEDLINLSRSRIEEYLRSNIYEMHLNKDELMLLADEKNQLKNDLKFCISGSEISKERIKAFIYRALMDDVFGDENAWDRIYLFREESIAGLDTLFTFLLYRYKKLFCEEGLERLITDIGVAGGLRELYYEKSLSLSVEEKEEILINIIYEDGFGLGRAGSLMDFKADGISAGVNGNEKEGYPIWLMLKGREVELPYYRLSHRELIRIARLLSTVCESGQMSECRGYSVGELRSHARIIVLRPPFSESWAFFIRKFDSTSVKSPKELIKGPGAEKLIKLLHGLILGNQIIAISGMQGSGKTTLLMALVSFIPKEYTLRIMEQIFELRLRNLYPDRNIVTIRETNEISGEEGLNLLKKTDGAVTIVGEVASAKVAARMLEVARIASLYTLFTHHAKNTKALIYGLRNNLLSENIFKDEKIALEEVVSLVRFHVHLHMERSGKRYISKVSEIVPQPGGFYENVLFKYEDGVFKHEGTISVETKEEMLEFMEESEWEEYIED